MLALSLEERKLVGGRRDRPGGGRAVSNQEQSRRPERRGFERRFDLLLVNRWIVDVVHLRDSLAAVTAVSFRADIRSRIAAQGLAAILPNGRESPSVTPVRPGSAGTSL